ASGPPTASSSTSPSVSAREHGVALGLRLVHELAGAGVEPVEVAAGGGEQALERGNQLGVESDGDEKCVVRLGRHDIRKRGAQPLERAALLLEQLLARQAGRVDRLQALACFLDARVEVAFSLLAGAKRLELGGALLRLQPAPHALVLHRDGEGFVER